jgi:hypothetical protein
MEMEGIFPWLGSFWSTKNVDKIVQRKSELIYRDQLTKEYLKLLKECETPENFRDENKKRESEKFKKEIEKKWSVAVYDTLAKPFTCGVRDEDFDNQPLYHGIRPIKERPLVIVNNGGREPIWAKLVTLPGCWQETPANHLVITIGLDLINLNDMKNVKKTVQEIVTSCLKDRKDEKTQQTRKSINKKELSELSFLHTMRENTFRQYLRWYDIHTQENLSFRLIAVIENIRKENISGAEKLLERFIHKRTKWGLPVKGEDRIEKGVKLIFTAIHRKTYVHKENKPAIIEKYSCPSHGNKCRPSCKYYKDWAGRFDRLNKTF